MAQFEDDGYDPEAEQRRQEEDRRRNEQEQSGGGGGQRGTVAGAFGNYTDYGAITDKEAGDPLYNQRQAEFEGQTDWDAVRRYLQQEAQSRNVQYDESDLQGIQRNAGYDASHQGAGGGYALAFQKSLENAVQNYNQRMSNTPGGQQQMASGSRTGGGAMSGYDPNRGSGLTNQWLDYIKQRDAEVAAQRAEQNARAAEYWNQLKGRSQQALNSENNPVIRQASDAYRANEDRASRNYLADLAEKSGPYANLRGEQRLASERVGQRTGSYEAQLAVQEMSAQREEIAQALQLMGSQLSIEQQRAMQEQLALLDAAIREQGIELAHKGLDQDWQRALMQNDQFLADLGLRAEDQSSWWDWRRSQV